MDENIQKILEVIVKKPTLEKAMDKELIHIHWTDRRVTAIIVGVMGSHAVWIDLETGDYYCSCIGFLYNFTVCSHLARLLIEIGNIKGIIYIGELSKHILDRIRINQLKYRTN